MRTHDQEMFANHFVRDTTEHKVLKREFLSQQNALQSLQRHGSAICNKCIASLSLVFLLGMCPLKLWDLASTFQVAPILHFLV